MSKFHLRLQAQELRKQGWSLNSIAQKLLVSKSSVSLWCREINLSPTQVQLLKERQKIKGLGGRLKGAKIQKEKRQEQIRILKEQGLEEMHTISKDALFMAGLGLFWGEGEKSEDATFGISNSDPEAIKFMISWLTVMFHIPISRMCFRIRINKVYQPDIEEILDFWYKVTDASPQQFLRTVFIQTENKKVYQSRKGYYGVLTLRVYKSSYLQRKILGLLSGLKNATIDGEVGRKQ